MVANNTELELAADTLREWALDESLKRRVLAQPALARAAQRVARRYTAGMTIESAIAAIAAGVSRGHLGSIDFVGESARDVETAKLASGVFLEVVEGIRASSLPSTVSLDLSHVGSVIDYGLGLAHATEIAIAAEKSGIPVIISAEGSDRTDITLDIYDALASEHSRVGITLQARLHRTPSDLDRVLEHPGIIRIVKGSFLETDNVAYRRESPELTSTYLELSRRTIDANHAMSIATHDEKLVAALISEYGDILKSPIFEFEMLLGLGTRLLDELHADGYRTREYVIFGNEWWLYVLNRIAEHPDRIITALADLREVGREGGSRAPT